MKVTYEKEKENKGAMCGDNVAIGTAFSGSINTTESVFLRTCSGIVDIRSPEHTWSFSNGMPGPQIFNFQNLGNVELIKEKPRTVYAYTVPVGMAFSGKIGATSSVFLRIFGSIVDLRDPGNTWTSEDRLLTPTIKNFKKLNAKIVIEKGE